MKIKKKKGVTLIELIAVIAIIAILSAIVIPNVISYIKRSRQVAIKQDAQIIYNGAVNDYDLGGKYRLAWDKKHPFNKIQVWVVEDLNNFIKVGFSAKKSDDLIPYTATLGQLKEVMNMPVDEIPIKDGALNLSALN